MGSSRLSLVGAARGVRGARLGSGLWVAGVASASAWACTSSEPADAPVVVAPSDPAPGAAPPPVGEDDAAVVTPVVDASADVAKAKSGLACSAQEDLGGGRTSCVTKVGSVELKIVTPKAGSGSGPMRLGLYLHGDGAAAHKSGSALKAMAPWVDARHGLGVSARAPNGCSWWLSPTHDCASTHSDRDVAALNVAPLAAALDAIMNAYDVHTDGLRYYGSSGGSIFLTDAWIPLEGARYPGVFALMCGGEASRRSYAWDTTDATLRAKNPLWFTYGDRDALFPTIQTSITAFKARSFLVTDKVIPGAGHCEFDAHGEAIGIWTANP